MIKTWTRREVIAASIGLSAISPGISVPGLAAAATARPDQSGDGKRVTLLHFTDTHAQLETHPEYLPGAKPEIQMMGGSMPASRPLSNMSERTAKGPASSSDGLSGCILVLTGPGRNAEPTRSATDYLSEILFPPGSQMI